MDSVLVSVIEKLGITGSWKIQDLKTDSSQEVLWKLIPEKGAPFLIRMARAADFERLRGVYSLLREASAAGIPVNVPVLCEAHGDEVAVLVIGDVAGRSGSEALSEMDDAECEEAGFEAGSLLRQIHKLPVAEASKVGWAKRSILEYEAAQAAAYDAQLRFADQDRVEDFVEERIGRLAQGSVGLLHGDYHPQNFVIRDGRLSGVLGFESHGVGDPVMDLSKVPWLTLSVSEVFARGQFDGYLVEPDQERFWERYNLWVAMSIPSLLVRARRLEDRKLLHDYQYRVMEIVNTHDFTDGGPPGWY